MDSLGWWRPFINLPISLVVMLCTAVKDPQQPVCSRKTATDTDGTTRHSKKIPPQTYLLINCFTGPDSHHPCLSDSTCGWQLSPFSALCISVFSDTLLLSREGHPHSPRDLAVQFYRIDDQVKKCSDASSKPLVWTKPRTLDHNAPRKFQWLIPRERCVIDHEDHGTENKRSGNVWSPITITYTPSLWSCPTTTWTWLPICAIMAMFLFCLVLFCFVFLADIPKRMACENC